MNNNNVKCVLVLLIVFCVLFNTASCTGSYVTYTYDELSADLVKAEIVTYSTIYEPEYQFNTEIVKTLSAEECDYAISEIANMKFEKLIVMEPNWPRENVLVFYYPTYELQFSYSGWVDKATEESETGKRGYNVDSDGLEELINHLLNN
ncbi:MAG: hypothetical protein IJW53_02695 [Clostridia bacterium]|nr:hypothetical protein [Clostridia bacterium]